VKLHHNRMSPFARKVMMVAHEAGISASLELISVETLEQPPDLLAVNPLCKVPCLVPDDGPPLFDSRVICEYIDLYFNASRLFPREPEQRIAALRWQALADGIMDAAVLCRYEGLRSEAERSTQWIERQRGKIERGVELLESEVEEGLRRAPFSIAQLAISAALGYLDLRFEDMRWREGHPKLTLWYSQMRERRSIGLTDPIAQA
jgi:glutathione S-transferase